MEPEVTFLNTKNSNEPRFDTSRTPKIDISVLD